MVTKQTSTTDQVRVAIQIWSELWSHPASIPKMLPSSSSSDSPADLPNIGIFLSRIIFVATFTCCCIAKNTLSIVSIIESAKLFACKAPNRSSATQADASALLQAAPRVYPSQRLPCTSPVNHAHDFSNTNGRFCITLDRRHTCSTYML